ncbi:MAG: hypothetical protein F4X11_25370 [Acidobacteria bacterium]|nr:hypothetical protein [Acidobacteriota bacterium]
MWSRRSTQHQRRTRGLRPQTLRGRARLVRMLVRAALGADPLDPARLAPADVVAFITSLRGRFSPGSMRTVRSTLRSFFRFLRFEGSAATSSSATSDRTTVFDTADDLIATVTLLSTTPTGPVRGRAG